MKLFHKQSAISCLFAMLTTFMVTRAVPVLAQNYRFSVPEARMQLYVQPDASVRIVYDIAFVNQRGAHPIDVVDIGMPHAQYDISNMTGSIDEVILHDIRVSQYVKPGVEVHLRGQNSIMGGESGTFHFEFTMPNMVYQDTTREDYASLRITPTWFGKQFVVGSGSHALAIHMLPGVQPEEMLYHKKPYTKKVIFQDHAVAIWEWTGPFTSPYMVGVSFPKRNMARVVTMTKFGLLVKWMEENLSVRIWAGIIYLALLAFLFFRFSGGTGVVVYLLLAGVSIWIFVKSPKAEALSVPIILVLIFLNEWHSRRIVCHKYLPPVVEVPGGGIKRGLTAPEAALLLEIPVKKVLTLVIYGLLRKGVVSQSQEPPYEIEISKVFRATGETKEKLSFRRKAARERGIVLHTYEWPFLDALDEQADPQKPWHQWNFSGPMRKLLEHTAARMKGFNISETKEYYRSIVRRAVRQAKALKSIPQRERFLDGNSQWILMDDDPRPVFDTPTYSYRPIWLRTGSITDATTAVSSGGGAPGGATSFSDVAASFSGWAENTMSRMAGAIIPGSLSVSDGRGGVIDLSGFDRVTSDLFRALGEFAGEVGGGGVGCAGGGCACACACAGGGR